MVHGHWALCFALAGCASAPTLIAIDGGRTEMVDGRQFIVSELEASRVTLGPDPASRRSAPAFQAVVENRGAAPVVIAPENVRIRTSDAVFKASDDGWRAKGRKSVVDQAVAESREPNALSVEAEAARVESEPRYRDAADFAETAGPRHVRGSPCLACLAAAAHAEKTNAAASFADDPTPAASLPRTARQGTEGAPLSALSRRTLAPGEAYAALVAFAPLEEGRLDIEVEVGGDLHRFRWDTK